MKIFVDANVVIDYLVDRFPFADDAEAVIDACVQGGNEGAFTGLTACNAIYVIGRSIGQRNAELLMKDVVEFMKLLPIRPEDISMNLGADHPDFEDALQIAAAKEWGADVIVTRDKDGFGGSPVKVLTPAEFLNAFDEEKL